MAPRASDPGPRPERLALLISPPLILILLVFLALWVLSERRPNVAPGLPGQGIPETAQTHQEEGYLFCTWNVENLFDDQDDPKSNDTIEDWFGRHPKVAHQKIAQLTSALLEMNHGLGPDILAIVEVENRRAVELLRDSLNARLPTEWRYETLFHRDNLTGRRIEPALLSRLRPAPDPLSRWSRRSGGPHDFGIRRVLEARVEAKGAPLTVLVSHWTSRVTDKTGEKRAAYADALYRSVLDWHDYDPDVDLILSGDFNDEPDDPSVARHLRAIADPSQVRDSGPRPRLFNLMADRDPNRFGTYLYKSDWRIMDQIVVSPGLLDNRGWQLVPNSLRIANDPWLRSHPDGRPFRFGGPKQTGPRGYSDHFAVTVRLRVVPVGSVQ